MESLLLNISISNGAGFEFIHHFKTIFMKQELILKSDVLDILFENRNKKYGAYDLRANYAKRLTRAVFGMFGFVIAFAAISFIPKKNTVINNKSFYDTRTVLIPPKTELKKKEIVKAAQTPQKQVTARATVPEFTKPVIDNKTTVTDIHTIADSSLVLNRPNTGIPGKGPVTVQPVTTPVSDPAPGKPIVDKFTPTKSPDVMPVYPGGMEALRKFLERNLENPEEMEDGSMVNVKIQFVVGYDGKLKGFETVQDGGVKFNNEVIRVLKKMPDWVPGKTNGENISVYYTIPVKFVPYQQ